jgi:hypothetical protein
LGRLANAYLCNLDRFLLRAKDESLDVACRTSIGKFLVSHRVSVTGKK